MGNIDSKLKPGNLECSAQCKIWSAWHGTTTAKIKNIKRGFLDDCREHGIRAPDHIELITADGLCTLLLEEVTTYGVGFSILIPLKPVATFEAAQAPKGKKVKLPKKPPLDPDLVAPVMEFTLTEDERSSGWDVEKKADYLKMHYGVEPVYDEGRDEASNT